MDIDAIVGQALSSGASDLHLEAGLPAALRIRGALRAAGDPVPGKQLLEMARSIVGEEEWPQFLERHS